MIVNNSQTIKGRVAGESSASGLEKRYVGTTTTILSELKILQQELIAEMMEHLEWNEPYARKIVEKFFVGERIFHGIEHTLHVTEDGEKLWAERFGRKKRTVPKGQDEIPPAIGDVKPASVLKDLYVGSAKDIYRELLLLRTLLIRETVNTTDMDLKQATQYVEKNFVGMRKPKRGPATLYVTAAGEKLWAERFNRKKINTIRLWEAGDESVATLSKQYGKFYTTEEELEMLPEILVRDIVHTECMDAETARANVDAFLTGERRPRTSSSASLHTTQDGKRVWVDIFNREPKDSASVIL